MKDATRNLYNLKETVPREEGSAPIPAIPNIKTIVATYLKEKLDSLNLKHPIPVFTDFPPIVNLFQEATPEGRNELKIKRFVAIVRLSSSIAHGAVGQVIKSEEILSAAGLESTQYGWIEKVQLEVSYWSINPVDRDRGGDYIKLLMLEMHRNGYLLRNGVLSFNYRTGYDNADERIIENQMVFMHVMQFDLMHFFFGTEVLHDDNLPTIDAVEITPVMTGPSTSIEAILGAMDSPLPQNNIQYTAGDAGPIDADSGHTMLTETTSGPEGDSSC